MSKPSVSKITGLLDKPALLHWANKIGLEGIRIDEYRKKSMLGGTKLHKQIQNYLLDNIPFDDIKVQQKFDDFFKDKKLISIEKSIETDHFKGRLDIKFEYNNQTYICDFKSNQKAIYLENKLQLIAYRMAEGCDKIAVIGIPEFNFMEIDILDYTPYEKILINLSEICKLKEEIE